MGDSMQTDTRTFEQRLDDVLKDMERRNDLQEGKILELLDRDEANQKRMSELEGQIHALTIQQVTIQAANAANAEHMGHVPVGQEPVG